MNAVWHRTHYCFADFVVDVVVDVDFVDVKTLMILIYEFARAKGIDTDAHAGDSGGDCWE